MQLKSLVLSYELYRLLAQLIFLIPQALQHFWDLVPCHDILSSDVGNCRRERERTAAEPYPLRRDNSETGS